MNKVFALVDCNSFYVSCERVFNPSVKNKPVVVLSNNDGCAISRSSEAKAIGIAMGAPIFKCRQLVQKHGVEIFSANFVLYGDMSNRVMAVLRQFTPNLEVYSIDEAFLLLDGFESRGLEDYGRKMRADVYQQTGLPVSIGLAPTKTLAKIANHYAKDHPETGGVFCLMTEADINYYLAKTPVKEVWGIGKEKAIFLERNGIQNALELKNAPDEWVKKHLTIVTLRTVWELRGIACLSLEESSPDKKVIATTRTFGYEVSGIDEMQEAVAAYVSRSAEKLRRQKSLAGYIQVYVETNPFKDTPYYRNSAGIEVDPPTAYTPVLIEAANKVLKRIYRVGLRYKSCGVFLMNLCKESGEQEDLFNEPYQGSPRKRLMEIMDCHNRESNSGKLFLAAEGLGKPWFMKQAHKSKRFTTRWDELLEVEI